MANFRIQCQACLGKFRVPSLREVPTDCPLCGVLINEKEMPEVAAPMLMLQGGARTKSIDNVYRDAERASETRMEQAAAMTPGASASDFSDMKVTNYRSNMHEGDTAVRMPQPSQTFTQNVENLQRAGVPVQANGGMQLTGQAQAYSANTRSGPAPNAGAKAMDRIRSVHQSRVDPRMNSAVSSIPALETLQPNYERRS